MMSTPSTEVTLQGGAGRARTSPYSSTRLSGFLPLVFLLLLANFRLTLTHPPGAPGGVRGGAPGARTEAYAAGDGGTGVPETQLMTQQAQQAVGTPLSIPLDVASTTNGVNGVTGADGGEKPTASPSPGKFSTPKNLSSPTASEDTSQELVKMEQSMAQIRSALKKLEVDIAKKKNSMVGTDGGERHGPGKPPELLPNLFSNLTMKNNDSKDSSVGKWHMATTMNEGNSSLSSSYDIRGVNLPQKMFPVENGNVAESDGGNITESNSTHIDDDGGDSIVESSSEERSLSAENATTTQTVWRWNIQNATNSSEQPSITDLSLKTGLPLGKVCILLNGTVVKDMEEVDCKSQAGLHYKYIPSRLLRNGTNWASNSTAGPLSYTGAISLEEDGEEDRVDLMNGNNGTSQWEDEQWALYNKGDLDEGNSTLFSSSLGDNDTESSEGGRDELLVPAGMGPLTGRLLNISKTLPNPFESPVNGTRHPSNATDYNGTFTAAGVGNSGPRGVQPDQGSDSVVSKDALATRIDRLLLPAAENARNENDTETTSQVFGKVSKGRGDAGKQLFVAGDYDSMPSNSSGADHGVGPLSRISVNGSQLDTAERNLTLGLTEEAVSVPPRSNNTAWSPSSALRGSLRIRNGTTLKGAGGQRADSKSNRTQPNPKFIQQPVPSTKKPHSVHVYRNRYPPHAIHGLIWEDRRYLVSVLVPVGCGMAGAFIIVCLAYLSRHCRHQPKLKPMPNKAQHLTQFDRVMLLADSSDEDF